MQTIEAERSSVRERLAPIEYSILAHVAVGKSDTEIAREIELSRQFVSAHVKQLVRKLGARDRAEAVQIYTAELQDASPDMPVDSTSKPVDVHRRPSAPEAPKRMIVEIESAGLSDARLHIVAPDNADVLIRYRGQFAVRDRNQARLAHLVRLFRFIRFGR
jgi:DNA-binding CsgD family transcriptional regulator